jgi:hypothetical protein
MLRKTWVILVSFLLHLAVAGSILGAIYYFINRDAIRATQATRTQKLDRLDKMLKLDKSSESDGA